MGSETVMSSSANWRATAPVAKWVGDRIEKRRSTGALQNVAANPRRNMCGCVLEYGAAAPLFHWDCRFYRGRITSLNAVINFLFSSIVPTEMRTHSGKP